MPDAVRSVVVWRFYPHTGEYLPGSVL